MTGLGPGRHCSGPLQRRRPPESGRPHANGAGGRGRQRALAAGVRVVPALRARILHGLSTSRGGRPRRHRPPRRLHLREVGTRPRSGCAVTKGRRSSPSINTAPVTRAIAPTSTSRPRTHRRLIVTTDDHEVANNYAGDVPSDGPPSPAFVLRRAAAYQAYYEFMPLRRSSLPGGPAMRVYRSLSFGTLARCHVLDSRQVPNRISRAETAASRAVRGVRRRRDDARAGAGAVARIGSCGSRAPDGTCSPTR